MRATATGPACRGPQCRERLPNSGRDTARYEGAVETSWVEDGEVYGSPRRAQVVAGSQNKFAGVATDVAIDELLGSAGFSASSDIETLQRDEVTGALESTSWTNESHTYIHLRGKGGTESFFPIDIDESQAIVVRVGDGLQLSVDLV